MLADLEAVFGRPLAPLLLAARFQNWPRDRWARMAYSYDPPGRCARAPRASRGQKDGGLRGRHRLAGRGRACHEVLISSVLNVLNSSYDYI